MDEVHTYEEMTAQMKRIRAASIGDIVMFASPFSPLNVSNMKNIDFRAVMGFYLGMKDDVLELEMEPVYRILEGSNGQPEFNRRTLQHVLRTEHNLELAIVNNKPFFNPAYCKDEMRLDGRTDVYIGRKEIFEYLGKIDQGLSDVMLKHIVECKGFD